MSGFSGGSFSFSHSHRRRGGYVRRSHSSGHGFGLGGMLGHSHSGHQRGRYVQGGHYRQTGHRRSGCLGAFLVAVGLAGGSVMGLVSLLS